MKSVRYEFRRHSLKDAPGGKRVGPQGMHLARHVGESELRGRSYTHFFTGQWRTVQTLVAFDEGAGDFHALVKTAPTAPFYTFHPDLPDAYRRWHKIERAGGDMVAHAFSEDPIFAVELAQASKKHFLEWDQTHADKDHILVVGHSPEMEILLYGLTGRMIPQLVPCQGFRILAANEKVTLECVTPPPVLP